MGPPHACCARLSEEPSHELVSTSDMLAASHCQVCDCAVTASAAICSKPGSDRAQNGVVCSHACSHQYAAQLARAWMDCRCAHRLAELCSVLCMAPEPLQLELWGGGMPVVHLQHGGHPLSESSQQALHASCQKWPTNILICSSRSSSGWDCEWQSLEELRHLLLACSADRYKYSSRSPKIRQVQTHSHRPRGPIGCRAA